MPLAHGYHPGVSTVSHSHEPSAGYRGGIPLGVPGGRFPGKVRACLLGKVRANLLGVHALRLPTTSQATSAGSPAYLPGPSAHRLYGASRLRPPRVRVSIRVNARRQTYSTRALDPPEVTDGGTPRPSPACPHPPSRDPSPALLSLVDP